jgi:hypothetical protein
MKVNGIAFKKAREEIRKNTTQICNKLRGIPSDGTQEWLAYKARIRGKNGKMTNLSVRTIQYLEKGEASIQVIDAVSPFLGINGRELIFNYGNESIKLDAPSVIDFRPSSYPREFLDFPSSPLLLTIDPLIITFSKNDDIDTAKLMNISISMTLDNIKINFGWLYKVGLNPGSSTWLGFLDEVFAEQLSAPSTYRAAIMFHQLIEDKISWQKFIDSIENTKKRIIQLDVTVEFEYFIKNIQIGVVVSEMKTFFSKGRCKYNSSFPYFIQPKTTLWK